MKKRILSIVLVSVMLLAMIPALAVNAENPAVDTLLDYKTYRTVVTGETIKVDGQLDEIYKNAEKITASANGVSFEAYTAVTLGGLYVWTEIKDSTPAAGDKFRIYFKTDDVFYSSDFASWGWYDVDYNGTVTAQNKSGLALSAGTTASAKLPDGSGWRSETFIPFSVAPSNLKTYQLSIALEANNGSSVCYDKDTTSSAQTSNADYTKLNFVTMDDVPYDGVKTKNAVYVQGSTVTIDGQKDAIYSEHAKYDLKVTYDNEMKDTIPENVGTVYLAFDDDYIYVYYERYDDDLIDDVASSGRIDSFQTAYWFANGGSVKSGYFTARVNPDTTEAVIFTHPGGGYRNWPGTTIGTANMAHANAALGNNTYGIEYKMPIPANEKSKLASGGTIDFKMVFCATDFIADGTDEDTAPDTAFYAGCGPDSYYAYSDYTVYKDKMSFVTLSKDFTEANIGDYDSIYGASLSLGSDITVNYYANIAHENVDDAYMRFTRNGYEYIVYPKRELGNGMYKFAFTNIAPQNIGDEIKAELVINGTVVDTKENYNVRQNCINLLANETYASNIKMNNLIKALLNYGAAAQGYRGYNVEAPVSKGYKVELSTPTASDSVRSVGSKISDDLKMTSAGVYFDNDNKIYVKFTAKSLEGVTVTMNGEPASIEHVSGTTYIAYSNGITVAHFATPYRIVLSKGSASQVAVYSVNSYTYAKLSSTNEAMVELAKATYTYGDAAKKYIGLGDTIYKVMTYNDADNNAPYENLHSNVVQIIQDTAPDFVGMQEVQESQQSSYKSLLSEAGYGWIWNSRGTGISFGDDHYWGEVGKPSGVAIAYRTDKFTLKETKHFWLSDTPDTASKYDESDYTHDFVTALLEDKTTGERFVFVCVHLNYMDEANVKQAAKLVELMETADNGYVDYTAYRKIYVGDYNCEVNTQGYVTMNNAGYTETAAMISNVYKPSTGASSEMHIDHIYAKKTEFKAISYKVLNDHPLSLYTSDHYPVVSELLVTKTYEDVLLTIAPEFPDLPGNPVYDGYDDDFFSEEDRVGF